MVQFHNKEQQLQEKSHAVLRKLKQAKEKKSVDADVLKEQVHELYRSSCQENPNAFRPKLCENGENVLIDAIHEIEARLNSNASPDIPAP